MVIFIESKNRIFFFFLTKVKLLLLIANIHYIIFIVNRQNSYSDKKEINVALCTMGKEENLYLNEFIGYYLKLGINHYLSTMIMSQILKKLLISLIKNI